MYYTNRRLLYFTFILLWYHLSYLRNR